MSSLKPGDLGIIKCGGSVYDGRLVEIIDTAPQGRFMLPSGDMQAPLIEASWIIKFIGGPAPVPMTSGGTRSCAMACAAKRFVFPLPGDPEVITERDEATA